MKRPGALPSALRCLTANSVSSTDPHLPVLHAAPSRVIRKLVCRLGPKLYRFGIFLCRIFHQIFSPAAQNICKSQHSLNRRLADVLGFQLILLQCSQVHTRFLCQLLLGVPASLPLLLQLGRCIFSANDGVH